MNTERPQGKDDGKLRRWVANLQLESWQLELLITGFSIFLLATGIDEYAEINRNIQENQLNPGANGISPLLSIAVNFILDTIPIGMKFFLINLLIHLLLRGFWIGIVGLSSVSNHIDYDKLKFRGRFRKFIPEKVRSLDELIVYLDKVSSVIFAYTFLLVFSIISVVIVLALGLVIFSFSISLSVSADPTPVTIALNLLIILFVLLYFFLAFLFFLDTLLFSAFKKSKWFTVLYYPIYRFFSVVSLSILYRSIYYHLITTNSKKQIIGVSSILFVVLLIVLRADSIDVNKFYPRLTDTSPNYIVEEFYDDSRPEDAFIDHLSLPSKYVENGFLELFIRYNPQDNVILELLCPEFNELGPNDGFVENFKMGFKSANDSTFLATKELAYNNQITRSLECQIQMFEVHVDGELYSSLGYAFKTHSSNNEKGYLTIIDVLALGRGRHTLEVKKFKSEGSARLKGLVMKDLDMKSMAKLNFWIE